MKKTIKITGTIILVLILSVCFSVSSHAGSMLIKGKVTYQSNGVTVPIAGAKVTWRMLERIVTVYTNSQGDYSFMWKNWCDGKIASASAPAAAYPGLVPQYKKVYEGSCCSCNPACPPEYGEIGCRKELTCNFKLVKSLFSSSSSYSLAAKPEVEIAADKRTVISIVVTWWLYQFQGEGYKCLYQWLADISDGVDIPDHPVPLPDCPEFYGFVDYVNDFVDAWWDRIEERRYPDEEESATE